MPVKRTSFVLPAIGLASACLFGAATPASKALLGDIQPQVLAGLLYAGAAVGVLPALVRSHTFQWPWRLDRRTLGLLSGAIVLGGIIGPILLLFGLKIASAGSVSMWLNLEFVATVLLGHFVYREHLTLRGWFAAGGTLVAAVLLTGAEGHMGFLSFLLVASACLCWGFDNHFTALIDGLSPSQTTFYKGVAAGVFNLSMGCAVAGSVGRPHVVVTALLIGAISYGVSVTLYIMAAQGLGATRSQMIFSSAPFFGVLFSVLYLGESMSVTQALAAVMIATSLGLLFSEKHGHTHRHRSLWHQHRHQHTDGHHNHRHEPDAPMKNHDHRHAHGAEEHEHRHWPDLHHRHDHEDDT